MNHQRSLFWPLTLIATGVIWILVSMNVIPAANLFALTQIWPYVLIVLGIGLILRGYWPAAGHLVSFLVVVGAVLAVLFAPQLGWAQPLDWSLGPEFAGRVPGSGVLKTESRDIKDVTSVSIGYPADVVIMQGDKESLTIEAEDNLLPQLDTDVVNGRLTIQNSVRDFSGRVRPTKSIKITIVVKDLSEVNFSSAGSLLLDGLDVEDLDFNLSGAGDVTIKEIHASVLDINLSGAGSIDIDGSSDELKLRISGFGAFHGRQFATKAADINITGAGSSELQVEDELDATVTGAGSVRYYGSPTVTQRITGAGDVTRAGE